jgi:hypothetical protein
MHPRNLIYEQEKFCCLTDFTEVVTLQTAREPRMKKEPQMCLTTGNRPLNYEDKQTNKQAV